MRTVYNLTGQDLTTHNGYPWTPGEWRETNGSGDLCGPGWLHHYSDPLLAVFLNPIHANIANPRLWEAEADGATLDDRGLKGGSARLRLVRELPLPAVSSVQRVAFGILCAMEVPEDPTFTAWAERWLSGADRTAEAAAWWTLAARAAWWALAAWEAALAAEAAAAAAEAAAAAAAAARAAAAWVGKPLDLPALARKAMEYN